MVQQIFSEEIRSIAESNCVMAQTFFQHRSEVHLAESDANATAAALADYFAIPTNTTYPGSDPVADMGIQLSPNNTGTIAGPTASITITITDGSGNCPDNYKASNPEWNNGVFTKIMD